MFFASSILLGLSVQILFVSARARVHSINEFRSVVRFTWKARCSQYSKDSPSNISNGSVLRMCWTGCRWKVGRSQVIVGGMWIQLISSQCNKVEKITYKYASMKVCERAVCARCATSCLFFLPPSINSNWFYVNRIVGGGCLAGDFKDCSRLPSIQASSSIKQLLEFQFHKLRRVGAANSS